MPEIISIDHACSLLAGSPTIENLTAAAKFFAKTLSEADDEQKETLRQRWADSAIPRLASLLSAAGGEDILWLQISATQALIQFVHGKDAHASTRRQIILECVNLDCFKTLLNRTAATSLAETEITRLANIQAIEILFYLSEGKDEKAASRRQAIAEIRTIARLCKLLKSDLSLSSKTLIILTLANLISGQDSEARTRLQYVITANPIAELIALLNLIETPLIKVAITYILSKATLFEPGDTLYRTLTTAPDETIGNLIKLLNLEETPTEAKFHIVCIFANLTAELSHAAAHEYLVDNNIVQTIAQQLEINHTQYRINLLSLLVSLITGTKQEIVKQTILLINLIPLLVYLLSSEPSIIKLYVLTILNYLAKQNSAQTCEKINEEENFSLIPYLLTDPILIEQTLILLIHLIQGNSEESERRKHYIFNTPDFLTITTSLLSKDEFKNLALKLLVELSSGEGEAAIMHRQILVSKEAAFIHLTSLLAEDNLENNSLALTFLINLLHHPAEAASYSLAIINSGILQYLMSLVGHTEAMINEAATTIIKTLANYMNVAILIEYKTIAVEPAVKFLTSLLVEKNGTIRQFAVRNLAHFSVLEGEDIEARCQLIANNELLLANFAVPEALFTEESEETVSIKKLRTIKIIPLLIELLTTEDQEAAQDIATTLDNLTAGGVATVEARRQALIEARVIPALFNRLMSAEQLPLKTVL